MSACAELEIAIGRFLQEKGGYPVVLRLFAPRSDQDKRFPDTDAALFKIDLAELHNLRGEDAKYEARLAEVFFQDPNIRTAFDTARMAATAEGDNAVLRVRLFLDAGAEDLHQVRWECLRDSKGKSLFNGDTILFSRYLASSELRPVSGKTAPKALIAIANPHLAGSIDPEDSNKELAPVDVANEKLRAETGLSNAGFSVTTLASPPCGTVAATSANILDELDKGYDILYLVCHGGLVPIDGKVTPMLWLEDGDDPVKASLLIEGIRGMNKQPRLVVLASCQSAGTDSRSASSTLGALGPLLAGAGVPAVIAMQGNIKMTTVKKFMPEFFKELAKDGQIDRAMAAARRRVVGDPDEPDCDDYWMPVLFMRLRSGRIWYQPGLGSTEGASSDLDKWKSIASATANKDCQCSPIIGPGALEGLVGSWREVAKNLAKDYGYPETSHSREDLPTVTQYIAVNQGRPMEAKQQLLQRIAAGLKKQPRFASAAMAALDPANNLACVPDVVSNAGRILRQQNPIEPHRLLASRPFSVYITVNPDDLMEDALSEAGRKPRSDFNRWNTDDYFDLMNVQKYPPLPDNYTPTADEPLVYHIFGKLRLPAPDSSSQQTGAPQEDDVQKASREEAGCGSYVVTEDDYFKYLLTINSKADAKNRIPLPVQRALAANALLFFGFRLDDWSFRVLLRSIFNKEGSMARAIGRNLKPCIGAQILPDEERIENPVRAATYYQQYFQDSKIDTFWGNVDEFAQAVDRAIPPVDRYLQEIQQKLGTTR